MRCHRRVRPAKRMARPSSYLSQRHPGLHGEKTNVGGPPRWRCRDLEAARARDIATHERNLPAMENNRLIAAQITALNVSVGMPARWSERDRNPGRYPKTIGHDAGYITDIRRGAKTDDGFDAATVQYERTLKSYREYESRGKREAEVAAVPRNANRPPRWRNARPTSNWPRFCCATACPLSRPVRCCRALRGRHQRLDLAVAMAQTRGDWSEGPYRVRDAMDRFTIRDNEDKDIANDVLGCMDDFEDGRVFRDTRWS